MVCAGWASSSTGCLLRHAALGARDPPGPLEGVDVPYKTIIEPASSFYYYINVTLPGDPWGSSTWSLAQTVALALPSEVSHEELVACMSQLKWLVDTTSLSDGIRNSLL
jgi:hypothetical protein